MRYAQANSSCILTSMSGGAERIPTIGQLRLVVRQAYKTPQAFEARAGDAFGAQLCFPLVIRPATGFVRLPTSSAAQIVDQSWIVNAPGHDHAADA